MYLLVTFACEWISWTSKRFGQVGIGSTASPKSYAHKMLKGWNKLRFRAHHSRCIWLTLFDGIAYSGKTITPNFQKFSHRTAITSHHETCVKHLSRFLLDPYFWRFKKLTLKQMSQPISVNVMGWDMMTILWGKYSKNSEIDLPL